MDHGVYAINMPTEWGGAGLSLLDQVIVEEEFGKATNCLWDIPWRPANVLAYGTEAQREKYLLPIIRGERFDAFAVTEPNAGSDPSMGTTTATRTDGGWLINGEKWFVTCGDVADFLVVQADALVDGAKLSTLFLVEKSTPGVTIQRTPHFMHSAVNGHPEFVFTDVFVADEDILGELGPGLRPDQGVVHRRAPDDRGADRRRRRARAEAGPRLGGPARAVRCADRVVPADPGHARGLRGGHRGEPGLHASGRVGGEINGSRRRKKTLHAKASMAKLSASEAAGRVIDRCVQIFGGRGYDRSYPVERMYRELRVDRIWEGTSEIQRLIIANEIIKRGTGALNFTVGGMTWTSGIAPARQR